MYGRKAGRGAPTEGT